MALKPSLGDNIFGKKAPSTEFIIIAMFLLGVGVLVWYLAQAIMPPPIPANIFEGVHGADVLPVYKAMVEARVEALQASWKQIAVIVSSVLSLLPVIISYLNNRTKAKIDAQQYDEKE